MRRKRDRPRAFGVGGRGSLDAARRVLRERFGHPRFRVHQLKVLGPLLCGRNVLAVLPTGAGKSLCYQVPALMGAGLTVVVSPLISLMQDQVGGLRRRGIAAAYVNSQLDTPQRRVVLDAATSGQVSLLYCAPERLPSLTGRLCAAQTTLALLAIDEAHCITEWGSEVRPLYRRVVVYRARLGHPTAGERRIRRLTHLHAHTPAHRARDACTAPDEHSGRPVPRGSERGGPAGSAARLSG